MNCVYCQAVITNDKNMCLNCGKAQPEKAVVYNEKPEVIQAKEEQREAPVLKAVSITCFVILMIPVIAFGALYFYLTSHPGIHL